MNFVLIALGALLVIVLALKWNNVRTKMAFYFITLGVAFVLLLAFMVFADKAPNVDSVDGVFSAVKTYTSWIGQAISGVVKVSTYAFNQGWKDGGNSTGGG